MRTSRGSWTIDVLPHWRPTHHAECLTLERTDEASFQLSSAKKTDGNIENDDLGPFMARAEAERWGEPLNVRHGALAGIEFTYIKEGSHWVRWYVFKGALLVFATLNGESSAVASQLADAKAMLGTIQIDASGA
jgi:hypothetical protein